MEDIYSQYREQGLTPEVIAAFRSEILGYYRENGRSFPWRETDDPYHLLISEVMLQQTQTSRVIGKFTEFVAAFPDIQTLAEAPLKDVLQAWQGLGYNRRALALQNAAKEIMEKHDGRVPPDTEILQTLPGVGHYTAGAIVAIAFDKPAVFVDTNIRAVYHWFFFRDRDKVPDKEILPIIEATFDTSTPRIWCFALFDYGVMLKQSKQDPSAGMRKKQSRFTGSDRQIRGNILRLLLGRESMSEAELAAAFPGDQTRLRSLLARLSQEGLVRNENGFVRIV